MVERTVKRRIDTTNAELPAKSEIEQLFDIPDENIPSPDMELTALLSSLGETDNNAKVQIYKRETINGIKKEAWLFDCTPQEFMFSDIQESYGAGEYRIRVQGTSESGHYGLLSNKIHTIGEPRHGSKKAEPATAQQDIAKIVADSIRPILDQQAQQQKFMFDMILAMNGNKGNQMEEFGKFAAALGALPQPQKQENPIQQFMQFAELMKVLKGDAIPVNDSGGVDGGSLVMSKGLELLGKIVDNSAQKQPQQSAQVISQVRQLPLQNETIQQLPLPVTTEQPAPHPQHLTPEQEEMNLLIRAQISLILNAATMNQEVETYAALIFENAPDELLDDLQKDDWFDKLAQIDKRIPQYRDWFSRARARVLEMIAEDLTDDNESDTTMGNNSQVPGNGDIPAGNNTQ